MAFIQVRERDVVIADVPHRVLHVLRRALRYRPAGYMFEPAYKYKKWDGWVNLFVDDCQFPVGLLSRVTSILDKEKVAYTVDTVAKPREGTPLSLSINEGVQERWYQQEAAEAALENGGGVVRAPTGSGKTVIAARIIKDAGVNAVVLVPTIDLLYQTREFLEWAFGTPVGMLGAGVIDPKPVTVATTRTMSKILDTTYYQFKYDDIGDDDFTEVDDDMTEWVKSLGLLIVDECHVVAADTAYNIATNLNVAIKVGLSASPWRDDNADIKIEAALGPIVYRVGVETLVQEGFLVPPLFRIVDTRPEPGAEGQPYDSWAKAYRSVVVDNKYRNDLVVKTVNDLVGQGRIVLLLVKQLKHGEKLRKAIPKSVFIAGSSPAEIQAFHQSGDRERILNDLRAGNVRCVIATSVADMGVDVPALDALVLAGGGKSSTRHLQRIGRVCRPFEGKTYGIVVDFDDSWAHVKEKHNRDTGEVSRSAGWFDAHTKARRKIEHAEWESSAIWI